MTIHIEALHRAYVEMDAAMRRGEWGRVVEIEQIARQMQGRLVREDTASFREHAEKIGVLYERLCAGIANRLGEMQQEIAALKTGRRAVDAYEG